MLTIPEEIKKALTEIGFDRAEQQISLLLLRGGLLTIQEITNSLKLPRSSIHLAIESLLEHGVVKVSPSGKRRLFYIEHPRDLENFVRYQENNLSSKKIALNTIMARLIAAHAGANESETIDIEELAGEDGFVKTFYKSLEQERHGEVLRMGGDPEKFTVAREKLVKYREERMKKKIFAKLLLPESPFATEEVRDAKFKMREVRILPKESYSPKTQTSIWADHVAFTVWDKGLHSIIIKNKAISDTMRQLFFVAWEKASKK